MSGGGAGRRERLASLLLFNNVCSTVFPYACKLTCSLQHIAKVNIIPISEVKNPKFIEL